jgi:GDP-L-fucose synthase
MKVMVTGGAGMIGSHLVDRLVEQNHEVFVFDNLVRGLRQNVHPVAKFAKLDMTRPAEVEDAFRIAKPDQVYHLAAAVGGVKYMHSAQKMAYEENVLMNTLTLKKAAENKIPYLYTSTACVYPVGLQEYGKEDIQLSEDMDLPANPESTYGWSKMAHEQYCKAVSEETGTRVVIVRPFNVYGPREELNPDKGHVIPSLIYKALSPDLVLRVWGTGNQTREFTYVDDAVDGILRAMERAPSAVPINLGSTETVQIKDVAGIIAGLVRKQIEYQPTMPEGVHVRRCNPAKAAKYLEWKAQTPLNIGIMKTFLWARDILKFPDQ